MKKFHNASLTRYFLLCKHNKPAVDLSASARSASAADGPVLVSGLEGLLVAKITAWHGSAIAFLAVTGSASFGAQDDPPRRESQIEVFGDDPCPSSTDDEIVVCHRRAEEERNRIPAPLRRSTRRPEQAWGARVETLDEVSRDSRPNSCSVVGTYGQTGCMQQMIRQWYESRRAGRSGR